MQHHFAYPTVREIVTARPAGSPQPRPFPRSQRGWVEESLLRLGEKDKNAER